MKSRRRTPPALPGKRSAGPHPDPQVEAQLEQIRALQRAAARKEGAAEQAYRDIAGLQKLLQALYQNGGLNRAEAAKHQEPALRAAAAELEAAVRADHELILRLTGELDSSALAFL
jgi:hypothetical protein